MAAAIPPTPATFDMRVEIMIQGQEKCLGMAGKEEVEKHDGRDHAKKQEGKAQMMEILQVTIDGDPKHAPAAIIDRPDGEKKIAQFPLIGIAAARTAIQWREVIPQPTNAINRHKDRLRSTLRTLQEAGTEEILQGAAKIEIHKSE